MAQFQGLWWISKQASTLQFNALLKHNMKTPRGLPRMLQTIEVPWTLHANGDLEAEHHITEYAMFGQAIFSSSVFVKIQISCSDLAPKSLHQFYQCSFTHSWWAISLHCMQCTAVKLPQCCETQRDTEREKNKQGRCNLCWCSLVQHCEIWLYCWYHRS